MRPHNLTIKAFGPFGEETTVDFDAMGNSVYLIAGETGVGKTSVFDALVYALYGTASGTGRSGLSTEELHSDLAKHDGKKEEMRVSLSFSNAGKEYRVSRRMYWGKDGRSKTISRESELTENGALLVSGRGAEKNDDVTKKIKELLGLDADQFRRIIMLAQGEFRKFLESDDRVRGEILGKLYDNRRHVDIQMRLKAVKDLLNKQDAELASEITAALGLFKAPEDTPEEEKEKLAADHPELLSVMEQLTKRLEEKAAEAAGKRACISKETIALTEQKATAEDGNKRLDELEAAKKERDGLEKKEEEYNILKEKLRRSKAAARVLPAETAGKKAEEDWKKTVEELEGLVHKEKELEEEQQKLTAESERTEKENGPEIEKNSALKTRLEQILSKYDDLASHAKTYTEKETLKQEAAEVVTVADGNLNRKIGELENNRKLLETLEHAGDPQVTAAELLKNECEDRSKKLSSLKTLVKEIKGLENTLKKLRTESSRAAEKALEAEKKHLELNTRFLAGQAGFLAEELRKELEDKASVICPVCGTVHTKEDMDGFAACKEDVPSREEVETALSAWAGLQKEASDAEKAVTEKETEVNEKRTQAVKDAAELGAASDWETLSGEKQLDDKINDCEREKEKAEKAYTKAIEDREKKQKAQEDEKKLADEVEEARRILGEKKTAETNAQSEMTAAETRLEETKKQLEGYPESKKEAEQQIAAAKKAVTDLTGEITKAKDALEKCEKELSACKGNIQTLEGVRESREQEKECAEANLSAVISENGFTDDKDYHCALEPEGIPLEEKALEAWNRSTEDAVTTYSDDLREKRTAVKTLEESAKGIERKDTKELEERLRALSETDDALKEQENDLTGKKVTDREATDRMKALLSKRKNVKKALNKIAPLDEAANGRLSFSRFVLGEFFDSIIEQANAHLDTMTDGEYCIVHGNDGDERHTQGLGLRVLNTVFGFERANATLSGGQSFEAALALALGLSDVVQMQSASTVQIDSMYIDEGFGSLDGRRLDNALAVLSRVSGGNRQIGIISHIDRLEECLPRRIRVIPGEKGSTVKTEID